MVAVIRRTCLPVPPTIRRQDMLPWPVATIRVQLLRHRAPPTTRQALPFLRAPPTTRRHLSSPPPAWASVSFLEYELPISHLSLAVCFPCLIFNFLAGTGLLAGGLGGALLGHALTPSGGSSSSQGAAAAPAAGQDRIIIINNGVPVNATDGTTVINAGGVAAAPAAAAAAPAAPGAPMMNATQEAQPAPLAPMAPMNPEASNTTTDAAAPPPPPAGGIICVPTKVNETDPTDSTKMVEVEKIACYPAPPPPAAPAGEGPAPLAPMTPVMPGSQQVQQAPDVAAPVQASVKSNQATSGAQATIEGQLGRSMLLALMCGFLAKRFAGF